MHHCLQVSEILSVILESLVSHEPDADLDEVFHGEANGTYASMARTCKSFYAPSMNVLWSSLPRFDPLVKCLPQEIWQEQPPGSGALVRTIF